MDKKKENRLKAESGYSDGWFGTAHWLIMAFSMTLVFIVFQMQAYTIPTGSMADTLKGAHFRLKCEQCGYGFDFDYYPREYGLMRNTTSGNNVPILPSDPCCPSCGHVQSKRQKWPVIKGDRIFVLKCIYQFLNPKRWDVVVFKNPLNPKENYIKRMIALPGETVEIIDGDIYIDGQIARKPEHLQNELWMPVYDNNYHPAGPDKGNFKDDKPWRQPFRNMPGSQWDLTKNKGTIFSLNNNGSNEIFYDTSAGNDFRATYAYDIPNFYRFMPVCSDLKVSFYNRFPDSSGSIGASISKYGIRYQGTVGCDGKMSISRILINEEAEILASGDIEHIELKSSNNFSFSVVDHLLILQYGSSTLEHELGLNPSDAGEITTIMPEVKIIGSGNLEVSHLNIFRDIHYLGTYLRRDGIYAIPRAGHGDPLKLNDDEYFVCGDNSPSSLDARLWDSPGIGNIKSGGIRHEYRMGTVPRDYMVGKAFFVYWPGPHKPFNDSKLANFLQRAGSLKYLKILMNVPDPDGMKIIYGGK